MLTMNRAIGAATILAWLTSTCVAQQAEQQPAQARDLQQVVVRLSKSLHALQGQRDDANNREVNAIARASLLEDEVAALRKRIAELEAQVKSQAPKADEDKQP